MIPRRTFAAGALALAAAPLAARAQQPGRLPRLAYLATSLRTSATTQALLERLRALGHVDGTTMIVEDFVAPTVSDLPQFAARAVASRPDAIVTAATPASVAAKALTTTIPIVFVGVGAPVEIGLVASLARPGGNVTGVSNMNAALAAKRLEMLKEITPGLSRVAVFIQPEDPVSAINLAEIKSASGKLGIEIAVFEAPDGRDFAPLFAAAVAGGAQAIQFVTTTYFIANARRLGELAIAHRLPTMNDYRSQTDAGGLVSYGPSLIERYRRAALYVDQVLRGVRPADLPVEQPVKFEMVLNMKTAKALGLEIPFLVLAQADEVIDQ